MRSAGSCGKLPEAAAYASSAVFGWSSFKKTAPSSREASALGCRASEARRCASASRSRPAARGESGAFPRSGEHRGSARARRVGGAGARAHREDDRHHSRAARRPPPPPPARARTELQAALALSLAPPPLGAAARRGSCAEARELESLLGVAVVMEDVLEQADRQRWPLRVPAQVEPLDEDEGAVSMAAMAAAAPRRRRRCERCCAQPDEAAEGGQRAGGGAEAAATAAARKRRRAQPRLRARPRRLRARAREARRRPARRRERPHGRVEPAGAGTAQRPAERGARARRRRGRVVVEQRVRQPLLLDLDVVDPAGERERARLEVPRRLVVGLRVE